MWVAGQRHRPLRRDSLKGRLLSHERKLHGREGAAGEMQGHWGQVTLGLGQEESDWPWCSYAGQPASLWLNNVTQHHTITQGSLWPECTESNTRTFCSRV